jgi:AcrR family transcriptional regulator
VKAVAKKSAHLVRDASPEREDDRARARSSSTRDVIMDAAERLMSEHGFAGVSVREIAAAAGVQFSAISYHFGSKESLLEAIFERRASAVNSERTAVLDNYLRGLSGRPPEMREIVSAFSAPVLTLASQASGLRFLKLQNIVFAENGPLSRRIKARHYYPMSRRIVDLMRRASPSLSERQIYVRFNFLVSALFGSIRDQAQAHVLSDGRVRMNAEEIVEDIADLLMFGLNGSLRPHDGAAEPRIERPKKQGARNG